MRVQALRLESFKRDVIRLSPGYNLNAVLYALGLDL